MKNPDKIEIAILDQGCFKWWENNDSDLAKSYAKYYGMFEMECYDFSDNNNQFNGQPAGSHGFWVMDRLLQVCGNPDKVKIINCKVFGKQQTRTQSLLNALDFVSEQEVDLVNLSLGIPRSGRISDSTLNNFNSTLNKIMKKGLTIISAGNEGEVLSNGQPIDNTNLLTDDKDNNLSVGSHNRSGEWDRFSSVGGTVDVSALGSDLNLLGERKISKVSGTSFSAPSFCGVCGNYLIDQFSKIRNDEKTVKEVIYEHLDEAIKPVYRRSWKKAFKKEKYNPWFGKGSFESYVNYFIKHYGRDVLQYELFLEQLRTM